jgi:hypothetical protein
MERYRVAYWMSRRILNLTLGILSLAAARPAIAAPAEPAKQPPSLEGKWTLNEDLTARLRESDEQRRRGDRAGSSFGRYGAGGRRGEGNTPGAPPESAPDDDPTNGFPDIVGADPSHDENQPRPSFMALNQLTIAQQGRKVTITDLEGHARVLTTDGSKLRDDKALGGSVDLQAKWDRDGSLVVDVRPAKGPRRTETYIVSSDRKHLYVVLDLEGDGRRAGLKIRRAYDPVVPTAPAAPAAPAENPVPPPPPAS